MNQPVMFETKTIGDDTLLFPAYMPVPGFGVLPVNAFLIQAREPVLVDTGLAAVRQNFLQQVSEKLDWRDLAWIWITHGDADHIGNLPAILELAPNARVVTTFLGMGKMAMQGIPANRMYLLNPGQCLSLADRDLQAMAPPTYDAPETTALFDTKSRNLFSADCFGALLQQPWWQAEAIPPSELREGSIAWARVDAPWLHLVDKHVFDASLDELSKLQPRRILSAHLPPAEAMLERLLSFLQEARQAPGFVGPDQTELHRMMAVG